VLEDLFGRRSRTLRVSVTDRCNFRCRYCMPAEDMQWFPREGILSFEEIGRLVRLLVRCGVERVRLTGGEPTLRRDLPVLVRLLAAIPEIAELNMTTNGVTLPRLAGPLRDAGLQSLSVSLDSLDRETFREMTRRDGLEGVLAGLDAARAAGFPRLKVNCVTQRGRNDREAVDFARFARERDLAVRFIEWMPLDGGAGWAADRVVPGEEMRAAVHAAYPLEPAEGRPEAPERPWRFADGAPGRVGFINPVTQPFCARCDRLRLTADGKVKNCMFDAGEVDVMGPMRAGASDEDLLELFQASVRAKGPGGLLRLRPAGEYAALRNMSRLGG
jgi:cyclic pyranopterin phosphate synthase